MATFASPLRFAVLLLLGSYLFVYPFGILLISLDMVPSWGTWMGGALLIVQGSILGLWLVLNYGRRGLLAALLILLLSWAVEHIGVTTGFPFGNYYYTDILNFKVLGVVPLAVPFAWLLVIPAVGGVTELLLQRKDVSPDAVPMESFAATWQTRSRQVSAAGRWTAIAQWVRSLLNDGGQVPADAVGPPDRSSTGDTGNPWFKMLVRVAGAASLAMLLDLLIEPVAAHINGYWIWTDSSGGYYGIPGANFAAWWVTSFVLAGLLLVLTRSPVPGRRIVYPWLPPLLYVLNLAMFSLVTLAHGKLLAACIGGLLLLYLGLVWLEPRLVRWIMDGQSTVVSPDQPGG